MLFIDYFENLSHSILSFGRICVSYWCILNINININIRRWGSPIPTLSPPDPYPPMQDLDVQDFSREFATNRLLPPQFLPVIKTTAVGPATRRWSMTATCTCSGARWRQIAEAPTQVADPGLLIPHPFPRNLARKKTLKL